MSCITTLVNFLPVNFGKCTTMSQPPGLLPAFINFKWLTQIMDVEVVWCEVLSHHPFCTTVDSTGQKKRLYFFLSCKLLGEIALNHVWNLPAKSCEWQWWFHSIMFWNTNIICSTYMTQWQKAQTDLTAWPFEARKRKLIERQWI